jgi:hypothetical protein
MEDHAIAHAEQVDALFAIVFALADPLDPEWIAERLDRLTGRRRHATAS